MRQARKSLRVLLAFSTVLSPLAACRAAETSAGSYLTDRSVAAVTLRVAEATKFDFVKSLPIEVLDAATKQYLNLPVEAIDRVTLMAEPPAGPVPLYAAVLSARRPVTLDDIVYELTAHTENGVLEGKAFLESQQPEMPSFLQLGPTTIAVGPKSVLRRLARGEGSKDGSLARAMTVGGAEDNHLQAAVMLEPLRPLAQIAMSQMRNDAPPAAQKYFGAIDLLAGVVLAVDLAGERASSLTAYANNESDADFLADLIDAGVGELRTLALENPEMQRLTSSASPIELAMAQYAQRSFRDQVAAFKPQRKGAKAFVLGEIAPGQGGDRLAAIGVTGFLIALLLPAVQAAREAARRNKSMYNMKQIVLALHNHHDVRNSFPAQAIIDADGKPLLSWRVAILPFIEQQALYDRFKLDEPWNSPNNLPLLAEMPVTFLDPSSTLAPAGGKTHYLGVAGDNAVFTGEPEGIAFRSLTDGSSKTIAVVQVNDQHAVEWTKPADYDVQAHDADPVGGIGSLHPSIFLAAFADGSVQAISLGIDADTLRAMFTRNGGEIVNR